jgi:DNA-binding transcriptional MerR regulator
MSTSDAGDGRLLTIGELARRAGVATSTVRFYERRGLLAADTRRSGQRRFHTATLRRLVFIEMLQDAGLTLADIAGILDALDKNAWKAIAGRRLATLHEEIARLQLAREYLGGALLCRFDHPVTDCEIMEPRSTAAWPSRPDSSLRQPASFMNEVMFPPRRGVANERTSGVDVSGGRARSRIRCGCLLDPHAAANRSRGRARRAGQRRGGIAADKHGTPTHRIDCDGH